MKSAVLIVVIVLGSCVVLTMGFILGKMILKEFIERIRGKKMVKIAKKANYPVLVINRDNGVLAVCSFRAFEEAAQKFQDEAIEEQKSGKIDKYIGKREYLVIPTFTFSDEEHRIMAHTGEIESFHKLRRDLVERVTGYRVDDVDWESLNMVCNLLMVEKKQLLIPFKRSDLAGHNTKSQLELFGGKSLYDAYEALMPPRSK
jgi:hypothetical protein